MDRGTDTWAAALPRRTADRIRALALPVLLVVIAGLGAHRTASLDQSSWQGASFGMFATYDNASSRIVRVTVEDPSGPLRLALPDDLDDDARALRVVPTVARAERLAAVIRGRLGPERRGRVVVEVWRVVVERRGDELRLGLDRLLSATAGAEDP